ncbi:MAG: hypothetical protein V1932_01875, partial [Chloroflexota bacterium]
PFRKGGFRGILDFPLLRALPQKNCIHVTLSAAKGLGRWGISIHHHPKIRILRHFVPQNDI